jgi:hypothetical protein
VASNFTKEELTANGKLQESASENAKSLMKQNLGKCYNVWQSFTKFING